MLQRDGESSYYINGTHVRRRDITDLFLGTGLGPRAYAIIEQGMISRVIEAKPEELRVFLEEAAGISKYKERRKETESRLADTRENLSRITDIRLELGTQIEKLQAQATVATRYQELQADLQLKQHLLWYLRRRDAGNERERHSAEVVRVGNELEAENANSRHLESQLETARAAHYQAGDAMNAAQGALYGANSEVARLESELRHAEETRARLESQHTERRTQLASWREQRSQLTLALHMWAARAGSAKQRVVATKENLETENARLPQAEQGFRSSQEKLNEARSLLMQAESRLQLEQANRAHLQRAAEALTQRRERLQAELGALVEPENALAQELEARVAQVDEDLQRSREAFEALQAQCAALQEASAKAAEAVSVAQREHAAARGPARHAAPDPGRGGKQCAASRMDRAPRARRHGTALPQAAHRCRLGNRRRGRAARASACAAIGVALDQRASADQGRTLRSRAGPSGGCDQSHPAGGQGTCRRRQHRRRAGRLACRGLRVEGTPDAATRAQLAAGQVLVNREGDQFTRHTISFHAPDRADAGILARQAEIESLEERCAGLGRSLESAQRAHEQAENARLEREAALEEARLEIGTHEKARHDVQIEQLKLAQAQERYRERRSQLNVKKTSSPPRRRKARPRCRNARRPPPRSMPRSPKRAGVSKRRARPMWRQKPRSRSSGAPCSRPSARRRMRSSASANAARRSRRSTTRFA